MKKKTSSVTDLINEFGVIGYIHDDSIYNGVPIINIPMMSDERWIELCNERKEVSHDSTIWKQHEPECNCDKGKEI